MTHTLNRWTDDDCLGMCRCPTCGGVASWSMYARIHACVDPECATQFLGHDRRDENDESDDDE